MNEKEANHPAHPMDRTANWFHSWGLVHSGPSFGGREEMIRENQNHTLKSKRDSDTLGKYLLEQSCKDSFVQIHNPLYSLCYVINGGSK